MAENREHQLVEGDAVMRVSGGGHFKQKSIKSKFVSISLRDKLIFLFVGTLFVELLLFGCVMSFYLYINAKKNVSDNIDTTVTAVSEVMDQSFLVMENLVLELAASNGVQNWLDDSHYYDRENSEFYLRKTEFSRELNRILIYSNAKKLDVVEYAAVFNDGYLLDYVDVQSVGGNKVQREKKMYNVIVADDEKNIREGIVELIEWEKLGCKVCASMQNGAQVLKYLEEEKIHVDIIITDIKMPIMDGMELIGMLNERFPDIKVIILTAYSDFTYAQQAIKFQVSDFVVKNDFFLELPRAVKKIIEQCEVDAKKCVGREKEIPFFQGEACRVCACEMRDIERYDYEVCKNRIEEILNSTFLDHKVVVAEGESGMLIFVIEYKGSEENAAWFQRRLEKVVSIAKIFQNIRLRIGAGKVVKSAEWGRVGKKQAIRNLSDIYTDNSPVNVKENYTEYIQYWKDENDVESYMRRLYVALRSGMEENKKLCAEEFEEYLKQETRPIEQCRSDTHAIILYLVRKVKSKEKMEKILVPEKALDAVYRSKSKAALAEVMRETCEAISTILEEEQKEGSSLSRKVNSIIERDYRGKISLKDIGKELFVNSSYLSRVYKKETGYTVTDAINSYRIEKAKEILETGEYRVCEVGEMVGIEDPAYFTHVFLKYEGKSPSDFMNR